MDTDARFARELEAGLLNPHMRPIVPIAENCRVLLHTLEARIGEAAWRDITVVLLNKATKRCTVLEETVPTTDAVERYNADDVDALLKFPLLNYQEYVDNDLQWICVGDSTLPLVPMLFRSSTIAHYSQDLGLTPARTCWRLLRVTTSAGRREGLSIPQDVHVHPTIQAHSLALGYTMRAFGRCAHTLCNCSDKDLQVCARCRKVAYCCVAHQKEDWKLLHKIVCCSGSDVQILGPGDGIL
jgi:hypothetical protein